MFQLQCSLCHCVCQTVMATHADICSSLRQWITAHYGKDMSMGRVCCRGSCCPINVILCEAPVPDALLQSQAFACSHLLWWTTAYEHTDLTTYSVGGWLTKYPECSILFGCIVPPYFHIRQNFFTVTHGVGACTHRRKLGVGSKEWQMAPPIFFLPNKYSLAAELKRGK